MNEKCQKKTKIKGRKNSKQMNEKKKKNNNNNAKLIWIFDKGILVKHTRKFYSIFLFSFLPNLGRLHFGRSGEKILKVRGENTQGPSNFPFKNHPNDIQKNIFSKTTSLVLNVYPINAIDLLSFKWILLVLQVLKMNVLSLVVLHCLHDFFLMMWQLFNEKNYF